MQEATASHSKLQPTILPIKWAWQVTLQPTDSPCNYGKGKARIRSGQQTSASVGKAEIQFSTYHVTKVAWSPLHGLPHLSLWTIPQEEAAMVPILRSRSLVSRVLNSTGRYCYASHFVGEVEFREYVNPNHVSIAASLCDYGHYMDPRAAPGFQNPNCWHAVQKWRGIGLGAFQGEVCNKQAKGGWVLQNVLECYLESPCTSGSGHFLEIEGKDSKACWYLWKRVLSVLITCTGSC